MNNYAFIDGTNLYLGVKNQGWKLDYKKFRVFLKDKYKVSKALERFSSLLRKFSSYIVNINLVRHKIEYEK